MEQMVLMPKMSKEMTKGKISHWKFNLGNYITAGDVIVEVETDKATMELEAFVSGFLLYKGANKDESVRIDGIIAVIGKKGAEFRDL